MFGRWKNDAQYEQVGLQEDSNSKLKKMPLFSEERRNPVRYFFYPVPFLSGVSLTIIALALWAAFHTPSTYEKGFHTDIDELRPILKVVPTKFTGTLKYKGEHLYIDLGPNGLQYFGRPHPGIDKNWDDLLHGVDNDGPFPGDTLGPDVLHTLHCLNAARKMLDSEYYHNKPLEAHDRGQRIHIDHCLNHIRQVIQCHMDITPVHTLYFESMNTEVGNFDQVHMCRDFNALHQYMLKNDNTTSPLSKGNPGNHREGYVDNAEALLPWDTTREEFE